MDREILKAKIAIVLEQEKYAYSRNGRQRGGLGSFSVGIQGTIQSVRPGQVPELINSQPNHGVIHSVNADILLTLYSSLTTDDKTAFKDVLVNTLDIQSEYKDVGYLIYYVLYRVGEKIDPIESAKTRLGVQPQSIEFSNVIGLLAQIVVHEYDSFDDAELSRIIQIFETTDDRFIFQLKAKANAAKLRILVAELDDVNPEINADRDRIVTYWEQKLGSTTIPQLAREIDELFTEGQFDDTKLATCLGRVRVMLIEALKELSKKFVEAMNIAEIPENATDAEVINWFKNRGILGAEEKELVRGAYDVASRQGSHASMSKREFARITKNVTYECIVMVVGMAENLQPPTAQTP